MTRGVAATPSWLAPTVLRAATVVLLAALFVLGLPEFAAPAHAKDCDGTSVGFTSLDDLAGSSYKNRAGGLYPGGTNNRPNESTASAMADGIGPVDASGNADPEGRYGLLSIGMSNTKQEFARFIQLTNQDPDKEGRLVAVNGARGGVDATMWADPDGEWWDKAEGRVKGAGLTPAQVAVVWVKLAIGEPSADGWAETERLQGYLADVARILKDRFPNVQIAYYSSRIYAGYADTELNPEPYAYEGAFAVKWLIEDQIDGDPALNFERSEGPVKAPLLTWGPYLWADGLEPRSDGLIWECKDFTEDGTHPSDLGSAKVADLLLDYFTNDSTARRWYSDGETVGEMRTTLERSRAKVGYRRPFTLSGKWSGDAGCTGPRSVQIRKRVLSRKAVKTIASVDVGANGSWLFEHRSGRSAAYTAAATPTENCDGDSSAPKRVLVRAKVTANLPDRCSSPQQIRGRVFPNHRHTIVRLQRRRAGSWQTVDRDKLNKNSKYAVTAPKCSKRHRVVWPKQAPDNLRGIRTFTF